MTTNAVIKHASVSVVSIKDVIRKCGLRESRLTKITGDPELEPWFIIYLSEQGHHYNDYWVVTKDGDSYHRILPDCFLGPKERFSSDEQSIIQEAIREYVKQQIG